MLLQRELQRLSNFFNWPVHIFEVGVKSKAALLLNCVII